jgi:NDP-sugar pyrophosphorylase family protein
MWPRAQLVPKTLLPVNGEPFAYWQLRWLAAAGVTSVVYSIGHLGEQVRDFVRDGSQWGLEVSYADEGDRLRGTAGALRLAAAEGLLHDRFLLLYGDSWLQVDPGEVSRAHARSGLPGLMTVYENNNSWDLSNAAVASGLVIRYDKVANPRPRDMRWIDYGLSSLTLEVVSRIDGHDPQDLGPLLTDLARRRELAAHPATERFYEIGSPEGLAELEAHLRDVS